MRTHSKRSSKCDLSTTLKAMMPMIGGTLCDKARHCVRINLRLHSRRCLRRNTVYPASLQPDSEDHEELHGDHTEQSSVDDHSPHSPARFDPGVGQTYQRALRLNLKIWTLCDVPCNSDKHEEILGSNPGSPESDCGEDRDQWCQGGIDERYRSLLQEHDVRSLRTLSYDWNRTVVPSGEPNRSRPGNQTRAV